nr:SRPBCC domain-containing protein [Micromonospora sp. DSM 115978]
MEYGTIEREIHVDASHEVVFEVVSSPEHLKEWWPDEADLKPAVGATGHIVFHREAPEQPLTVPITVVEAQPPRRFSFRWVYEADEVAGPDNSLLVTFDLEPSGEGTRVRMTETGFRERGWEAAVLEQAYQEHTEGWDFFIPRLGGYVRRLVASS